MILVHFNRGCDLWAPDSVQPECDQRRWKKGRGHLGTEIKWERENAKRKAVC